LGGYLAGKTEVDHYNSEMKREYEEVETVPEIEKQELRTFFSSLGLSNEIQNQAVEEVSRDKEKWVELMMKYELGLEKPNPKRAAQSAFNIGFSYIVGGLIPLCPYFFVSTGIEGLKISSVITLVCLFIFGYFKSKFTGVNKIGGAFRVMMIGALAAGCAFAIARLIQGHY
jgi:VIT1/CCC1 family predicted Fe2+/Mn2+ transporter